MYAKLKLSGRIYVIRLFTFLLTFTAFSLSYQCQSLFAQTPDYFYDTGTTANNNIPLGGGFWADQHNQWLYLPGDFGSVPEGQVITHIYLKTGTSTNNASSTYVDFEVSMGQPSITGLGPNWVTGLTKVFDDANYTTPSPLPIGDWFQIELDEPFVFNPNEPLVVETVQSNTIGGGTTLAAGGQPIDPAYHGQHTQAYGSFGAPSPGSTREYSYAFGFDAVNLDFDLGVVELDTPETFNTGLHDIGIKVRNNGMNVDIGSANIGYQFNNETPVEVVNFQFPDTLEQEDEYVKMFTGQDGIDIPAQGSYELKMWATNPNGIQPDSFPDNDTLHIEICTADEGLWVIDGSGSGDFETFEEAFNYFSHCGLNNDVTFQVEPGTYDESFEIDELPGSGPNATLTVDGQNAGDVTLESDEGRTAAFYNINHITFQNLTIASNTDQADHEALYFMNSHNITIDNVNFEKDETDDEEVVIFKADSTHNVNITNSKFTNGGTAISLIASGPSENVKIIDNEFDGTGSQAITMQGFESNEINNNEFYMDSGGDDEAEVLVLVGNSNSEIKENLFHDAGKTAIKLINENSSQVHSSDIVNNVITGGFRSSESEGGGIYSDNSSNLNIYHNSIVQNYTDANIASFTGTGSGSSILNNIFLYTGGGNGELIYDNPSLFQEIDHNIYRSNGSSLIYYNGTSYSSLSNYQSATTEDQNSHSNNPGFHSTTDLRLESSGQVRYGAGNIGVEYDYYGNTRDESNPVIGAHEGIQTDISVVDLIIPDDQTHCGIVEQDLYVILRNEAMDTHTGFDIHAEVTGDMNYNVSHTYSGSLTPYSDLDTVKIGYIDTRDGGNVNFEIYHDLQGDENHDNDTISVNRTFDEGVYIQTNDVEVCGGGQDITLQATAPAASEIRWYPTPNSQNVQHIGESLDLNNVSSSITLYLEGTHANNQCINDVRIPISAIMKPAPQIALTDDNSDNVIFNDGSEADPDHVFYNGNMAMEIQPPSGKSNDDYGSTWEIDNWSFTDESGSTPNNWTFNEPSGGNAGSFSFTPEVSDTAQTFQLQVELTDHETGCEGVYDYFVNVRPTPIAEFSYSGDVCAGEEVTFENHSFEPGDMEITYEWFIGQDTMFATNDAGSFSYMFDEAGQYQVTLYAYGDEGGETNFQETVTIHHVPDVAFDMNEEVLCTDQPVEFNNETDEFGESVTYSWNLGDGEIAQSQDVTHNYEQAGTYSVSLNAESSFGCESSDEMNFEILESPEIDILSDGLHCEGSEIEFSSIVDDSEHDYHWEIEGESFEESSVTYTFNEAGSYEIHHELTDQNGCFSTLQETIDVHELPVSTFSREDISGGVEYRFSAASQDYLEYSWELGDGTVASGVSVEHEYTVNDDYEVILTVLSEEGCESSSSQNIQVVTVNLMENFEVNDKTIVYPNPFSESLNVALTLESESKVNMELLNMAGQSVLSKDAGNLQSGEHLLTIDAQNTGLAEGAYILQISIDEQIINRKVNFN